MDRRSPCQSIFSGGRGHSPICTPSDGTSISVRQYVICSFRVYEKKLMMEYRSPCVTASTS